MPPLVSVIIPAYNAATYLPACLDSVFGQTHTALEVIVVDDGSSDATPAILSDYAARDRRLRILHTPAPASGPSVARNLGVQAATGQYFCFVDSDDLCDPDMVAALLAALDAHPEAMYASAPFDSFTDGDSEPRCVRTGRASLQVSGKKAALQMLYQTGADRGLTVSLYGKLFRMAVRPDFHLPEGTIYEDLQLLPQLTAPLPSVVTLRTPLYHYRVHPTSLLGRFTPHRLQVLQVAERLRQAFADDPALRRAADTRLFAAAFNMLLLLSANKLRVESGELRVADPRPRQLAGDDPRATTLNSQLSTLNSYRRRVLLNRKARLRDRVGALAAYVPGMAGVSWLLRTFPSLPRRLAKR